MTEEEKYINNLFRTAKNEPPKRSYKEVVNHLEKTIVTTSLGTGWSNSLLKYMNLNLLLITIISSLIIAGFSWMNAITSEQTIPLEKVAETIKFEQSLPQQKELDPNIPANNTIISIPAQLSTVKAKKENLSTSKIPAQKIAQKKEVFLPISITKIINPKKEQLTSNKNLSVTAVEKKLPLPAIPTKAIAKETSFSIANKTTTVNQTATPSATKLGLPVEQSKLLRLRHSDNEKIATTFLEKVRSYGFGVTEKVNRNSGKIERVNLHISLYKGLDWKVKLKNFEVFELKILLDEYKNPIGLAYRLSDTAKFSEMISLKSRARSSHKFSKNNDKGHHTFTKYIKH